MSQTNPTTANSVILEQLERALNQVPELKKLRRVYVCHGETELRLFIEAYTLPDQQEWLPKICKALNQVRLQTTYPVRVYGRKLDDLIPCWQVVLANKAGNTWKPAPKAQQHLSKSVGPQAVLKDVTPALTDLSASLRQQPFMKPMEPTLTQWGKQFGAQAPAVRWGAIALGCGAVIATVALCARPPGPSDNLSNTSDGGSSSGLVVDYALRFDGDDDIAIATQPDLPDWNAENGLTLSLWVYPTDYGHYGRILERSDNTNDDRLLLVMDHEEQGIRLSLSGNYAIGSGVQLNQWNHVVGVYDGAHIWVYIDGENRAKEAYTGEVSLTESDLLVGNNRESDRPFAGYLAEIQVWDRVLTDSEIAQMAQGKLLPMDTDGFGLSWSFDQDSPAASLRDQTRQLQLELQTTRSTTTGNGPSIVPIP